MKIFLALDRSLAFCSLIKVPFSMRSGNALDRNPWASKFWPQVPEMRLLLLQVCFSALLHSMWFLAMVANRSQEAKESQSISRRHTLMPWLCNLLAHEA